MLVSVLPTSCALLAAIRVGVFDPKSIVSPASVQLIKMYGLVTPAPLKVTVCALVALPLKARSIDPAGEMFVKPALLMKLTVAQF